MNSNTKYINEAWLSNQLAWLLDSRGTHGLGSEFAKKFFPKVLVKQKLADDVKFEKFEVIREFFLQVEALDKVKNSESVRRLDLVYMDLAQNTIIVIENKYDGRNSKNQLSEYMSIQELFLKCRVYYIYLDYYGYGIEYDGKVHNKEKVSSNYNEISWKEHVFKVLEELSSKNYEVLKLYNILKTDTNFEIDFTIEQLLVVSEDILNKLEENLEKNYFWEKKDLNTISNGRGYPIDINIIGKNIQIQYGHKRKKRFQISNELSNKQILIYVINILINALKDARSKSKGIDSIQDYMEIFNYINQKYNLKIGE